MTKIIIFNLQPLRKQNTAGLTLLTLLIRVGWGLGIESHELSMGVTEARPDGKFII